ncbi:helix-turn-helix domain-containing protein [Halomonas rituensis]|uniref:Transposase n=1 Tax=Vreelandella rituensis TaxID=2282306 RepID=A0A368U0L5_9GAMM|nr:hypothetical protein DU506_12585 [Halomonas rituensis]
MKTERAYKYRFYPTPEQEILLARTFGCVRFVWNAVLRYRTDAFYQRQETLNVRTWDCPDCGTQGIDRDVNAARNILQAGTALLAGAES